LNVLLDTCTFLWVAAGSDRLSEAARSLFAAPENRVFLSAVSAWEIAVKHGAGRLPLSDPPDRWVPRERERHGIEPLPLDEEAVLQLPRLPDLHRDPFDRMLVCQAIAGGLVLLTPDREITQYPVRCRW
jgi:PIN domain nuclease of toxin-antitoxin system